MGNEPPVYITAPFAHCDHLMVLKIAKDELKQHTVVGVSWVWVGLDVRIESAGVLFILYC
jgi:hypothetical protein